MNKDLYTEGYLNMIGMTKKNGFIQNLKQDEVTKYMTPSQLKQYQEFQKLKAKKR